MKIFMFFFLGLFTTALVTPFFRFIARRLSILDLPSQRKVHFRPVPLLGGLAIAFSFTLIIFGSGLIHVDKIAVILLASLAVLWMGFFDDLKALTSRSRLLIQFLAALFLIANSLSLTIFPDFGGGLLARWLITFVWIIGITNAVNYLDGLDGLCAGFCAIACFCFAAVAFATGQGNVLILSLLLCGCCLGFLPYNLSRKKIFLGDAGSNFLGFLLAAIAVYGVWAKDRFVGVSIPVLILGVPIFDMCFTTVRRIVEGKVFTVKQWLDYAGKDHFHHRLVDLGLKPRGAVVFIYLVTVCLGISAIVMLRANWRIAVLILIQAAAVFSMVGVLMVVGARKKAGWTADEVNNV